MFRDIKLKKLLEQSRKYWGTSASGCIFVAKDTGRILLGLRSEYVNDPHTWSTWGGRVEKGESPENAVKREASEETGFSGTGRLFKLYTFKDGEFEYHNFLILVPTEFTPDLNWEHNKAEWVEFGDWPTPIHFGLKELLIHSGEKIKRVIQSLKNKSITTEALDLPPAIHQHENGLDKSFIDYIKRVENGGKVGFKNGKWFPHKSPEGGNPTIGYGHKIQNTEKELLKGISDKQAEELLIIDLLKSKKQVYKDIEHMFHVKVPLNRLQEEMLIDFAFNLGNLRSFPKFTRAVLEKDWKTVKQEYKRSFRSGNGERKELSRNKDFSQQFLSNLNELQSSIQKKSLGIEDEDAYGYELRTPYSWMKYLHNPYSRTFSIQKIGTDPEFRNQGHAKELLNYFFQMVKDSKGTVEVDSYTTSGYNYIKPAIEKLGQLYKVRVI